MECHAGNLIATGNLRELRTCWDCKKREIGPANLRCAVGLQSEHGAIGCGGEISGGVVCGEGRKLIWRRGIPKSERATGRVGEGNENLITVAIRLDEGRARETGYFSL